VLPRAVASIGLVFVVLASAVVGCGGGNDDSSTTNARTWSVTVANNLQGTAKPKLTGPTVVTPGQRVTLRGRGYLPHMRFLVSVIPAGAIHATGTGIVIRGPSRVREDGRLQRSFTFPRRYCVGGSACYWRQFRPGMRVAMAASGGPGIGARTFATVR
jgi:hypothetical protein